MKFFIEKHELEQMLNRLSPFLDKNIDSTYSNFLIEAEKDRLTIKATNLKMGLSVSNSIHIEEDGKILVDGARLIQIVKSFKNEYISISFQNGKVVLQQGKSKFEIKAIRNTDRFLEFPTTENKSRFRFSSSLIFNGFSKILPTIDSNSPKYELTGGLISIEGEKIYFVGTDTKRLSVVEEKIEGNIEDIEMILPRQAMIEIPKLFSGDIEFIYNDEFLIIETSSLFFFTRLISGKYPNWKKILPKKYTYQLEFGKDEFLENLKIASVVVPELKISILKEGIKFKTLEEPGLNSKGETFLDMDILVQEPLIFGVNSRFIRESLGVLDGDSFFFGFNSPNLPISIWSENYQTIIMPIHLEDDD